MKTKTELHELNYIFNSRIEGDVFLFINSNKTTIKLENIFVKFKKKENNIIRGWSLLENFNDIKEYLKNENIDIAFKNEANESLEFTTEAPFWQMNDKEVDAEDYETLINKIKELSLEVSKENNAGENGPGNALPGSVILNNEKFQRLSERLKREKFEEFRTGNYVLFAFQQDRSEDLIVEVTENGYDLLNIDELNNNEINASKQDGSKIVFQFQDDGTLIVLEQEENSVEITNVFDSKELDEMEM